jgi:hypothetical protein
MAAALALTPPHHNRTNTECRLGELAGRQRDNQRSGRPADDRPRRVESLPGWRRVKRDSQVASANARLRA